MQSTVLKMSFVLNKCNYLQSHGLVTLSPHFGLKDEVHFRWTLGAYVVLKPIIVRQHHAVLTRRIETDAALAVEVVNRVVEEIIAVSVFSYFSDRIEVDHYPFGRPKSVYDEFFLIDNGFILDQKKEYDRYADNTKAHNQKKILGIVTVPLVHIGPKTKSRHDQPDADPDVIPADVLFFKIGVTRSHLI